MTHESQSEIPPEVVSPVPCHRCGESFTPGEVKVCPIQPYELQIVVCAEKPWVDPREAEDLQRRISMHKLIWWLKGGGQQ